MTANEPVARQAPALRFEMRLDVRCGPPIHVGRTVDGERTNYPILGGTCRGPALQGEVLSGTDFFCRRPDDVGVLDAHYALRLDDGTVVNVHNRGLFVLAPPDDADALRLPDGLAYRCHCTPRFDAPEGPHAHLGRAVFAGTVCYPEEGRVLIDVYRLL